MSKEDNIVAYGEPLPPGLDTFFVGHKPLVDRSTNVKTAPSLSALVI